MLKRSLIVFATLLACMQASIASAELKIGVYDAVKLQEDISKNAGTIYSEEEYKNKQLEFQSKRRELQLLAEDTERLATVRRNEVVRKIQSSVDQEVSKFAEEEGYDLILRSGVLFAGPKVNITQKILQRMSSK